MASQAEADVRVGFRGARGFTVADVAQRAHVGKGTVYLYWPTKEDLLLGLVGRAFLSLIDDLVQMLTEQPDLARPSRFCPLMVNIATSKPLVAALQRHDEDLLGVLTQHPRSMAFHEALGPGAVLSAVLPIWRQNGLARTDWAIADQVFALHGLIAGIVMSLIGPAPAPVAVDDPMDVLGASVTALLGPDRATRKRVRAAAADITTFLGEDRASAVRLLGATGGA